MLRGISPFTCSFLSQIKNNENINTNGCNNDKIRVSDLVLLRNFWRSPKTFGTLGVNTAFDYCGIKKQE
jgi:hypothetical protein